MSLNDSWPWPDADATAAGHDDTETILDPVFAAVFTRCFTTSAGRTVLHHLCSMTLDRTLAPEVPESVLRHLEGQRFIVRYLHQMVERGREAPGSSPRAISKNREVDTMPIGEP